MCMDNEPKNLAKNITVMGIGGGGMNIINREIAKFADLKNVKLISVNTDKQLLETAKTEKLLIGEKISNGLGSGGILEKGEKAAESSREEIAKELTGADKLIIIACLGGGTGTAASYVISKIAKEMNIKTAALVTLPFDFEGKKRNLTALDGLKKLKEIIPVYSFENNSILENVDNSTSLRDAFRIVDSVIVKNSVEYIKNNDDSILETDSL